MLENGFNSVWICYDIVSACKYAQSLADAQSSSVLSVALETKTHNLEILNPEDFLDYKKKLD